MIGTPATLGQLSKRFQHEDLFITDVVSKVEKAKLESVGGSKRWRVLLSNICKYMDKRFRSLQSPPVSCF